jgi:hypothetical protein
MPFHRHAAIEYWVVARCIVSPACTRCPWRGPGTLPPMSVRQNPPKWPSNPQCFWAQIRNIGQSRSQVTYVTSRVPSQKRDKIFKKIRTFKSAQNSVTTCVLSYPILSLERVCTRICIDRIFPDPGILIFGNFSTTSRIFEEEVSDNQCFSDSFVRVSLQKPILSFSQMVWYLVCRKVSVQMRDTGEYWGFRNVIWVVIGMWLRLCEHISARKYQKWLVTHHDSRQVYSDGQVRQAFDCRRACHITIFSVITLFI